MLYAQRRFQIMLLFYIFYLGFNITITTAYAQNAQETARSHLLEGKRLYDNLDYDKAIIEFRQAINQGLTTVQQIEAYEYLALCYIASDDEPSARNSFKQILTLAPAYKPSEDLAPRVRRIFQEAKDEMGAAPTPQAPIQQPIKPEKKAEESMGVVHKDGKSLYKRGFYLGSKIGSSSLSDDLSNYLDISDDLFHFALKVGYDVSKYFAIQTNFSVSTTELKDEFGGVIGDFTANLYDANAKITPLSSFRGRVRPYIVAGLSVYQPVLNLDIAGFKKTFTGNSQVAGNFGLGVNVNLSRRNSLGAEVISHSFSAKQEFEDSSVLLTGDEIFTITTVAIEYFFTF